jgi:hypothetical protein
VRRGLPSLAAVLALLSACSSSSNGGFAPTPQVDAGLDATTDATSADSGEEPDNAGADVIPAADSTCTIPGAATGAASSRCTPDGPGAWACEDASAQGWIYSCQESAPGAHPQPAAVGGCSAFGAYDYDDASYVVALCANAACTPAVQYDTFCDSGTAIACPSDSLDAGVSPGSGCVPSYIGEWSSGDGLPGTLYCCP